MNIRRENKTQENTKLATSDTTRGESVEGTIEIGDERAKVLVELEKLAPPFHERIYSVKEVSKILGICENQVTKMFEREPGVRDLAQAKYFGKRRRMLRIPHSVLERVWNRAEVTPTKTQAQVRRTNSSN